MASNRRRKQITNSRDRLPVGLKLCQVFYVAKSFSGGCHLCNLLLFIVIFGSLKNGCLKLCHLTTYIVTYKVKVKLVKNDFVDFIFDEAFLSVVPNKVKFVRK